MPKTHANQAVLAFINAKVTGYGAPTDVISTRLAAVRLRQQEEVKQKVLEAYHRADVVSPLGRSVGLATGALVYGLARGYKVYVRMFHSGIDAFCRIVARIPQDSEDDTIKKVMRIMENNQTATITVNGHSFRFIDGQLAWEGK